MFSFDGCFHLFAHFQSPRLSRWSFLQFRICYSLVPNIQWILIVVASSTYYPVLVSLNFPIYEFFTRFVDLFGWLFGSCVFLPHHNLTFSCYIMQFIFPGQPGVLCEWPKNKTDYGNFHKLYFSPLDGKVSLILKSLIMRSGISQNSSDWYMEPAQYGPSRKSISLKLAY